MTKRIEQLEKRIEYLELQIKELQRWIEDFVIMNGGKVTWGKE